MNHPHNPIASPKLAAPPAKPIPIGTNAIDEFRGRTVRAIQEDRNPALLPWALCGVIVRG